jgi:predicted RNase H-like nuclease (RuvC/YqgF family)
MGNLLFSYYKEIEELNKIIYIKNNHINHLKDKNDKMDIEIKELREKYEKLENKVKSLLHIDKEQDDIIKELENTL